jgi:hypothetical protein
MRVLRVAIIRTWAGAVVLAGTVVASTLAAAQSSPPEIRAAAEQGLKNFVGSGGGRSLSHLAFGDVALPAAVGVPMIRTATATGGTAPVHYEFWIDVPGTGWVPVQNYSTENTLSWSPSTAGEYRIQVWVRNSGSTLEYDVCGSVVTFAITSGSSLDRNRSGVTAQG